MNYRSFITILIILFFAVSCGSQTKDTDKIDGDIFSLNKTSVELMGESFQHPRNSQERDSLLNRALLYSYALLEKSASILQSDAESEKKKVIYYTYLNKANILKELGRYDATLETLEELLEVKEDYPEAIFLMGLIYEKSGDIDSAMQKYKSAIKAYENRSVATDIDQAGKSLVLLFIKGKKEVLIEINKQIEKNPGDIDLLMKRQVAEQFNRVEFFKDF